MSTLIEGFKIEHSKIIAALKKVKEIGVLTKEGHTKLMTLLPDLLDHLWKEDERLYPALRKASEQKKKIQEILMFFENGLGSLHEEMLMFMTKYAKGVFVDNNFQKEYERLLNALCKRMEYEENILFLEYKKLN